MTCPICGKPVDALRAPAVRVDAGKVIPFCSKDCASVWESKPVAVPRAALAKAAEPAKRVPAVANTPQGGMLVLPKDDNPVIEIVHEPASGVVASSADARTQP